jgi:hypothetical protein
MIKKLLLALGALVLLFAIVVALQPSEFKVARGASIDAPPAVVFAQINDFHKWEAWSPWVKIDPNAKYAYEGPSSGAGAVFTWDGNRDLGAGRMTLVESRPAELVRLKLEFIKPMEGTCDEEIALRPRGGGTDVTWTMTGRNNFIAKAFCLFMSMDKMVGGDFEKGLAAMKTVSETSAGTRPGRQP